MPKKALSAALRKKLEQAANKVMNNAHAPYSNFHVGAAILLTNGKVFSGCNVENASYGMTNCAERTAIFSAVAELGPKIEIRAVAVVTEQKVPCSPCGACRQVIYELEVEGDDTIVVDKIRPAAKQLPPDLRREVESLESTQDEIRDSLEKIAERLPFPEGG